jgi:hypothetical protein
LEVELHHHQLAMQFGEPGRRHTGIAQRDRPRSCWDLAGIAIKKPGSLYGIYAARYDICSKFSDFRVSPPRRQHNQTRPMRHLCRRPNALTQQRVRVNGLADHVAGMRANQSGQLVTTKPVAIP